MWASGVKCLSGNIWKLWCPCCTVPLQVDGPVNAEHGAIITPIPGRSPLMPTELPSKGGSTSIHQWDGWEALGGFLSHGGPPKNCSSSNVDGDFPWNKPSSYWDTPMTMETTIEITNTTVGRSGSWPLIIMPQTSGGTRKRKIHAHSAEKSTHPFRAPNLWRNFGPTSVLNQV